MSERRIVVVIGPDGRLVAETKGFKGKACAEALGKLLEDVACLNGAVPTAEAREKEPEPELRRDAALRRKS